MHKQSLINRASPADFTAFSPQIGRPGMSVRNVIGLLMRWQRRAADRAHLATLEPHRLDDIGLTQRQRDREAKKPFWIG